MKYFNKCECCGNLVRAYSHSLNSQLVYGLEQLVSFWRKNKRGCNLQADLSLTKNQYNNFQKLQYFQLVENKKDGWYPKGKGCLFIDGTIVVESLVATFGKEILDSKHEVWQTAEKKPRMVHISSIKNYNWKRRLDYLNE